MMNLSADSIQGVVFTPPGSSQEDALKLWDYMFPASGPDAFNRNPASPSLHSGANGVRDGHNVTVNVQVGRIDIVLSAIPTPLAAPLSGPPRISEVGRAMDRLQSYLRKVVVLQPALRLAIVLELAKTVDEAETTQALCDMVGFEIFPAHVTDAIYQINVRCKLHRRPNIEINRLCTWMAGSVGYLTMQPNVPIQQPMVLTPFVGLKIDVNTLNQVNISPIEQAGDVVDDIAAEVLALRTHGRARLVVQ